MAVENKYAPTEEELAYLSSGTYEEEEEAESVPFYQSIPRAAAKGVMEGGNQLAKLFSYLIPEASEEEPQNAFEKFTPRGRKRKPVAETEDRALQLEGIWDEYLPIEKKGVVGAISGAVERGGRLATPMLATGLGLAGAMGRGALGGVLGEGVSQLGGGPLAQNIAEFVGTVGPDVGKAIPSRIFKTSAAKEQEALIDFARKSGMAEEELNLALGERGPIRDFATDVSSKGGSTVAAVDKTKKALGRVWDGLKSSPEAQAKLGDTQSKNLITKLSKKLSGLPAEQRAKVMTDFNEFIAQEITGERIIDFWQKLNYTIQKGERGVGVLKGELQNALNQISPELGKDFSMTNKLYGKFSDLVGRMEPNIAEHLIAQGEKGLVISAVTTGNYTALKKVLGPIAARQIAKQMIINPRLKNLSARLINGLNRGSGAITQKVYDQMLIEVGKVSPEAAKAMAGLDIDEFFQTLEKENQSEN